MLMLVNCSSCHTPLQLPPGAKSIRCVLCQAVTFIADPRYAPSPSAPSSHYYQQPPPQLQGPSPYNHAPSGPPPQAHGSKRAVICGVSYKNTGYELKGCINDANCMKYLLVNRFSFPESSIVTLTGCQPGDSLVFHYSGHGSQQRNYTGDEVDGYDETLCPTDFESQGMIIDDEINATIVRPLPHGVKLHAIIDACHSGTVLDLPFLCRMDRHGKYVWEDHRPRSGMWKGTSGGEVISFSGCDDNQTSADTSALSRIASTGAMTYSFIQTIERGHATTYGNMLNAMRSTIHNTDEHEGGFISSLLTMLSTGGSLGGGLRQEPQLTASEAFDVYKKPFSL
ncbi:metacaspase-1-like isoform X2 [Herrania umbratica]|uniref:Metacaspase-1-like isoform X2 n=1 Tax=Herrania umbratica TaxID=108875 RepID=A0A6J1AJZ0_9ROSI|nr:metacaspase-1-like isoform X2 [Herrania umbratica]